MEDYEFNMEDWVGKWREVAYCKTRSGLDSWAKHFIDNNNDIEFRKAAGGWYLWARKRSLK